MTSKLIFLIALTCACTDAKSTYKICVPAQYMKACEEMLKVPTKSKALLECIPARDRVECLYYIQQRQADLVPVDSETMYVASKIPKQDFVVFQQYRTDKERDEPFRYEAVAVVKKDLPVNSLDQLKGLKSCHIGIDTGVGYRVPLTVLMKRSVFPKMNNYSKSPKENELRALSTFFNQSCIVGKWSPDRKTNSQMKAQYSQLCALCENPDYCNYPDNYGGHYGTLRCLAHNRGQVAFTTVTYVKNFFGLPTGTSPVRPPSENPDDFRYLCMDGSKVPVRERACFWAARPWQGLIGHHDVLAKLTPLREKIKQLAALGASTLSGWFTEVLGQSRRFPHVVDIIPINIVEYLSKGNYTEVIEKSYGRPEPVVRLCVTSNVAQAKCEAMAVFAFSRSIRPKLACVQELTENDCLRSVQDNGSDLASVDDVRVVSSAKKYNLHPVFHEVYGDAKTSNYAVAVVKKGLGYKKIEDLRGKRSCHDSYGTFSGLDAPLHYLINNRVIDSDQCIKNLGTFFSAGSCLPGIDKLKNNPRGDDVSSLKKQCGGDSSPAKCLQEDRGDVAFVSSAELSSYNASHYELLCLNREKGGRAALDKYATCNIAMAPSRTWLSAKDFLSDVSVTHTPLSLAKFLSDKSYIFNIYGKFLKNNNVIFNNDARGLVQTEKSDFEKIKSIQEVVAVCIR